MKSIPGILPSLDPPIVGIKEILRVGPDEKPASRNGERTGGICVLARIR